MVAFIFLHVGARFLGESVAVAQQGADQFMPFATAVSPMWVGLNSDDAWSCCGISFGGSLLVAYLLFLPYFPQSKHAHLFMAPLNFLSRPQRRSMGELAPHWILRTTASSSSALRRLEDLHRTQILDGFACIMCNRCQDVCPAYVTGKELSPAALESQQALYDQGALARLGERRRIRTGHLAGSLLSESALWACTACGACIDICPVGNEPMFDILDIRRDAVLMQSEFPSELHGAFNGMERQGTPGKWRKPRNSWTVGLGIPVPTVAENPTLTCCIGRAAPSVSIRARSRPRGR